jgi:hypothetical protein
VDVLHGAAVVGGLDELAGLFALELFEFGGDEEGSCSDGLQDGLGGVGYFGEVVVQQNDGDVIGLGRGRVTSRCRANS